MSEEIGKLFIGGVDKDTSSDEFRAFFEKYGELVDCILMKDSSSETERNRGFGFVRYKEPNCAEAVLKSSPLTLNGKKLDPKPCTPRGTTPKRQNDFNQGGGGGGDSDSPCKIFAGGIPQGITDDEVKAAFSKYGKVKTVQLMRDKTNNRIKGFAFITFETEGSAQQICSIRYVDCGGKTVECKPAESRYRAGQNAGGGGAPGGYGGGPNWQGPGGGAPGGGYNYGQGGGAGGWGGQQQMGGGGGNWGQQQQQQQQPQQMGSYGGQGGYGGRPNAGGPAGGQAGGYGGGYAAPQNGGGGYGNQAAGQGGGYGGAQQYNQGGGYGADMSGGSYGGAPPNYTGNTAGGGGQDMYGSGGPMSANYGQRMGNSAQPFHPYRR